MDNRVIIEDVSLAYLRECFDLDRSTGVLFWKIRPVGHFSSLRIARSTNKRVSGQPVGTQGIARKRFKVMLAGKFYLVHRIVFAMANDVELADLPEIIDHIDGNEGNNAPINLRPATPLQSAMNRSGKKDSQHRAKGVALDPSGVWRAAIVFNGKRYPLGTFATKEEAAAAYVGAAKVLHGEYFRDPRKATQAAA